MIGQNTVSGQQLLGYIERIEALRAEKKEAADAESAVLAEAKSNGFDTKIIRACVKRRAIKPHDLAEADTLLDMYLHAIGMASEPPLFRAMGLGAIDTTAREQIIDRLKAFVPAAGLGDIVVNMDGVKLRLRRDTNGDVFTDELRDAPATPAKPAPGPAASKAPVPDVDADVEPPVLGTSRPGRRQQRQTEQDRTTGLHGNSLVVRASAVRCAGRNRSRPITDDGSDEGPHAGIVVLAMLHPAAASLVA